MAWFRWNSVAKLSEAGFWPSFFGGPSYSGKSITPENALSIDTVWACAKLLSETLGTLPCLTIYKATNATAYDYYLYEILHDRPNADQTAVEFWEAIGLALALFGNAYSEKIYEGAGGRLRGLDYLPPNEITVTRDGNGRRLYTHTAPGSKARQIPESRMFHVRGMSLGGLTGMSPVEWGRHTMGAAAAVEEASGKLFANGMQAAGVLTSDQMLTNAQREQLKTIMEKYVGSSNAGKLMILEAGLKYQQLVMTPENAQMLETKRFLVEQICRWFGVPSIMVGHASEGQTMWGSGVEQVMLAFSKQGMRSQCKRVEAAIWRDLLTVEERRLIKVEFSMEGLLRGDSAARAAFYSTMSQNGSLTRNEIRSLENRPPLPGGDILTVQSALVPLDQLGAAPPAPARPKCGVAGFL